jgi:peptide/nickel transport system substrate-binding protein
MLILALIVPGITACGSSSSAANDWQTKRGDAANRIIFGISWEPVSFHPLRAMDSGSYFAQTLVYEGLIKYDVNLKIVPALAESFSVSADQKAYTFKLREGLRFSDGQPLTLTDVASSLALAASAASPYKGDYKCIREVERNDAERTIILHLAEPSAPLLARLVELRILPAAIINAADHGMKKLNRDPIASGPFQLKRWQSGLELVFEPNPFYLEEKPKIKELVWRIVPDKTLLGIALRRGELDVAAVDAMNCTATLIPRKLASFGRSEAEMEQVKTQPQAEASRSGIDVEQFNGSRTVYLGFNMHRPPFDNPLLRQAICMSINRHELARVIFSGYAQVPNNDCPSGAWYYNPHVHVWPYDPHLSIATLGRAGYVFRNRLWYRQGAKVSANTNAKASAAGERPLSFRIMTSKDFQDVAQVISDDLSQVGIATEVQVLEYTTLRAKYLKAGDFDVFVWSRSSGTDPECSLVWGKGGPLNFCTYSNPEVDRLIEEGRRKTDRKERERAYGQIQKILSEELPWVFLVQPKLLVAHKFDIENIRQGNQEATGLPWDNPLFNASRWRWRAR